MTFFDFLAAHPWQAWGLVVVGLFALAMLANAVERRR